MQIYSVNVAVFLGGNKPSRTGDVRGDISVNFSCDPDISSKLVCHIKSLHILEYIYPIVFYAAWVYWLRISSGWFCSGGNIISTGGRSFWRRCIDHPRNWTKSSWKWITGLVESVMLQLVLMHIGSYYFSYSSLHLLQIAGELLLVGSYSAELSIKAFFWRYWIHRCGNTDFLFSGSVL